MEILVLNLGSSSIKFKLFDMQENKPLASGLAEKIGEEIGQLKIKSHLHHNDQELKEKLVIKDHASGLLMIRESLTKMGIIKDFNQIDAIGHRVVQGGDKFHAPVLVNEKVMQEIGKLSVLAPLHNPANLAGIEFVQKAHPHIPQIAVFDTAFHATMPSYAYMYALPYELYEKYQIRRYGFHGTSHHYVAKEEARKEKGDKQAKLAFEMCAYRVKKHIGAYMVALGRVDAIIFTGGLGENYSALRESVCEGLENLGIALHKPTNDNPGNGLVDLSQPDSKVKVLLIPTDEELEIALQTKKVLEKTE
ncbi:hypothetical protein [Helicobacter pylori]|uniref:hypothetical protein n=1 Tax=Helicobacter pylori TaxID=210 RepID=UPI001E357A3A|nr:hypothetical protein [Helicobacter pylori]